MKLSPETKMLAEFMDSMNREGMYGPDVVKAAERAVKKAKLPSSRVKDAVTYLKKQDRV